MTREEAFTRLTEVFRDVFDDEGLVIGDATTADDIEEWDSFRHITLIECIEDELGIKFKMREVNGMKNVGEMIDIILERVGKG